MNLLSEDVTLWADGGGKRRAAQRPIRGREAVARACLRSKSFWPENYCIEPGEVNGQAALIFRADGQARAVLAIDVENKLIQTIRIIVNPEKLSRV